MKVALLCFVMPVSVASECVVDVSPTKPVNPRLLRSPYLDQLFPAGKPSTNASQASSFSQTSVIDFSTYHSLDKLVVRPVTLLVRRLPAKSETYRSIGAIHTKYRSMSILKAPRLLGPATKTKKRRKRRDHTAVRVKLQSKSNLLWQSLLKEEQNVDGQDSKKHPIGENKRKDKGNRIDDRTSQSHKRKLEDSVEPLAQIPQGVQSSGSSSDNNSTTIYDSLEQDSVQDHVTLSFQSGNVLETRKFLDDTAN